MRNRLELCSVLIYNARQSRGHNQDHLLERILFVQSERPRARRYPLVASIEITDVESETQINEQTLSFIPKLVGVFVALVLAGPWMLSVMTDYMRNVFTGIPGLIS